MHFVCDAGWILNMQRPQATYNTKCSCMDFCLFLSGFFVFCFVFLFCFVFFCFCFCFLFCFCFCFCFLILIPIILQSPVLDLFLYLKLHCFWNNKNQKHNKYILYLNTYHYVYDSTVEIWMAQQRIKLHVLFCFQKIHPIVLHIYLWAYSNVYCFRKKLHILCLNT